MKVRDDLIKDFGNGGRPVPTGTDVNNSTSARVNMQMGLPSELPSLFAGDNAGPPTNLPEYVTQATILAENEGRDPMMWAETDDEDV